MDLFLLHCWRSPARVKSELRMPLLARRCGVCKTCHQIGETAKNAVGPVLNGIIGRKAGSVAGYSYSDANKNSGITWDEATFREYIEDPKAKVPGTKMIYAGLKDEQKTNDLVAFLEQFDADGKKK